MMQTIKMKSKFLTTAVNAVFIGAMTLVLLSSPAHANTMEEKRAANEAAMIAHANQQRETQRLRALQNNLYSVSSKSAGCLRDVAGSGRVAYVKCEGKPNERWSLRANGWLQNQEGGIRNGKCLSVQKNGKVKTETCGNFSRQKWVYDGKTISPKEAGGSRKPKASPTGKQCLQVPGRIINGVFVWNCTGKANQMWGTRK